MEKRQGWRSGGAEGVRIRVQKEVDKTFSRSANAEGHCVRGTWGHSCYWNNRSHLGFK